MALKPLLLALTLLQAAPEPSAVAAAVARGVKWLRAEGKAGRFGAGVGESALALLALRHSGVRADDPLVVRCAKYVDRALPDGTVYGAALGILALLEQPRATHRAKIEKLIRQLAAGQCRNGQWTYSYRGTARKKAGDNSNTQIAVLALAAARVRRYAVPAGPLAKARAFFERSQNEDGGWGYAHNQRRRSYGSMTAGGAMVIHLAGGKAPRAFAWLADGFDVGKNRGAARAFGTKRKKRSDNQWRHYWLWSLERACAAAKVDRIGEHDWYAEGARFLVASQRKSGAWGDPEKEILGTCFALLFFARSTRIVLTPRGGDAAITPGGG